MKRFSTFLKLMMIVFLVFSWSGGGLVCAPEQKEWSDTQPRINLTHIFYGEINRSGAPVGFHSRPGGIDPLIDGNPVAGLINILDKPNDAGIYTAKVWIRAKNKTKMSSIYPDNMSKDEVIQAILNAFKNKTFFKGGKFRGPSGKGFTIEGYTLGNDINTGYPIYVKSGKNKT
jgi:hypothetical protein